MTDSVEPTRRVAIVEDDPNLLDHFITIVTNVVNLDLAGVASSVADARNLLKLKPDLFLVDIGLPDGSGLDLVPEIKEALDSKVLIITSFGDRQTVVNAIRAGADGYLLKDSSVDEITDGMDVTLAGGSPVSATAAVYLLERLRNEDVLVDAAETGEDAELKEREVELLNLFARGLTYKEAASAMGIAPLTINNYVKSIYGKLAVHSRSEAVYEALKTGQLKL
ncbi:response regulator transcription factor [Pontixanthobacter sp. CEM42]|uniref:response regulator n=1 Tax=Pontixanthobacter sp. CEM42 TaxID=2792077 RepID=UPI001AE0154E|nr:response regulator transcription factor [Pontixanthobacter sp. CEM42]